MTDSRTNKNTRADTLRDAIRATRRRYDALDRGKTASVRRCRTADEVALEGVYWRIGDALAREQSHLPHVVLLFPLAPHASKDGFSFGRYLQPQLGDSVGAAIRFRRLLGSRDRDELDHRLRGLLKLAGGDTRPVDWGILGTDILWFFADSGNVRRRWAQDFYAPTAATANGGDSAPSSTVPVNA